MSSKKLLIITYYWPPSGGVGVQRWMNFALQLKERGWEPIVLTPSNPQFSIMDEKLEERVRHIRTIKTPIWEPFELFHTLTRGANRKGIQQGLVLEKNQKTLKDKLVVWVRGNLFIPDPRVFWLKRAVSAAKKVIEKERIPLLVTTGPPHSVHLIGRTVKRSTDVKWIADFRDPWSRWDLLKKLNASPLALRLHQRLEQSVLKESDMPIAVSEGMAKDFGGINVLTNGITLRKKGFREPPEEVFRMGYFGMLNEIRNPTRLWMLLDQMCRENQSFHEKLEVRIGGIVSEKVKSDIDKLKMLREKVVYLGYLPHEQLHEEYQLCNFLLILQNQSNNARYILPVKFFEYLSAYRMLLCLGERESDLGLIMNKRGVGEILSYVDVAGMRAFIEHLFEGNVSADKEAVDDLLDTYSHQKLVVQLEGYMRTLIQHDKS